MDFGLGLVLSFTDNATTGINSAVSSMGQLVNVAERTSSTLSSLNSTASLSALSVMSSQLGSSVSSAGNKILGTFTNLVGGIQSTGSEFQSLRITLNALLKDSDKAEKSLSDLMNFAATTPFEISDLTGIFTTITANGLDAFKTLKGATTGYEENLMSAIGDLMAFRPDVPAQQWGLAIRNAFSGEVRSLKNALDINVNDMLGRKWGKSGDIAQDFMDLADAIGVAGMMSSNMDTLNQTLSNVSDQFTRIKLAIADTGVFDILQDSIVNLAKALGEVQGDKLEAVAQSIGGGLKAVLNPIANFTKKLANLVRGITDFIALHPKLTKVATVMTVLAGGLLVVAGIGLKLISSLAGVCIVLQTFNASFGAFSSIIRLGVSSILTSLLPLAVLLGALFFAWKTDFAGIKTMTTSFFDNITNSFSLARNSVNGDVNGLIQALQLLKSQDDVFSNMTIGIMRVMMVFKALADAWNDYTLTEENFQKARALGVLPLIEALLDLKYRFSIFKDGFIEGWNEIGDKIKSAFKSIESSIKGTVLDSMLDKITEIFQYLSSGDTDAWFSFGKSLGKFSANLLIVWGAFKLIGIAVALLSSPFTLLAGLVGTLLTGFLGISGGLGGLFSAIVSGVGKALPLISNFASVFFGLSGSLLKGVGKLGKFGFTFLKGLMPTTGLIVTIITDTFSIVASSIGKVLTSGIFGKLGIVFGTVFTKIFSLGKFMPAIAGALGKVGAVITSVLSASIGGIPVALILAIVAGVSALIAYISGNSDAIGGAFNKLWDMLPSGVQDALIKIGSTIKDFFIGITDKLGITDDIKKFADIFMTEVLPKIITFGGFVISTVKTAFSIVSQILNGYVIPVFKSVIDFIIAIWNGGLGKLVGNVITFIGGIITAIGSIVQWLTTYVMPIITTIVTGIINAVKPLAVGIIGVVNAIIDICKGWIQFFKGIFSGDISGAWEGIKKVFSGAFDFITNIFSGIGGFFTGIVKTIVEAFKGIGKIVGDAITSVVKTAINAVLGTAVSIINGFIKAINLAISVINAIPGVKLKKLSELDVPKLAKGGVVDSPTLSVIGEAGKEAVVPLENNTQWVGQVASLLNNAMGSNQGGNTDNSVLASIMSSCAMALNQVTRIVSSLPTNQSPVTEMSPVNNSNSSNTNSKVFTTNNNTNNNVHNTSTGGTEVNNTFEFKEGSIVIQATGTEDKDLKALAKKLMEYIKRETELNDMMNYN